MRRILLLTFSAFLLGFYSCVNDGDTFVIYDVEDEFNLRMSEILMEDSRGLSMTIETIDGFSCEEVVVDAYHATVGDRLDIYIDGIGIPNDCQAGDLQATKDIDVGTYPEGSYTLAVTIRESVFNIGHLEVSPFNYKIDFSGELNGLVIPHVNLLKIPNGAIWGRISYDDSDSAVLSEKLQSELSTLNAQPLFLEIGRYTNMEVNSSGQMVWDEITDYDNTYSFAFTLNEEGLSQLPSIIEEFRGENDTLFNYQLQLFTYKGATL